MKKFITTLFLLNIIFNSSVSSQTWSSLDNGLGISSETVKAVAVDPNGNIYAGGTFTSPFRFIAKWDVSLSAWQSVGAGLNGPVFAIAVKTASDIYVGGAFDSSGTTPVSKIARCDGSAFSPLGNGLNNTVKCIFIENSLQAPVFAGGEFTLSGTNPMNHIARWDNSAWSQLGSGVNTVVNAIVQHNGLLHAGTEDIAGTPVKQFDGITWNDLTGIAGGKVYALASYSNELYAGGDFTQPFRAMSRYDGTNWSSVVTSFNASTDKVFAFHVRAGILYIGGKFSSTGAPVPASYAAMKTASNQPIKSISATTSVLNDEVYSITNYNGRVIVGGKFTTQNHIAITNTTIGVDELNDVLIDKSFFPNPVKGFASLTINTAKKLTKPELKIYDVDARLIRTILTPTVSNPLSVNFQFDCSDLKKGNYFYVVSEDGINITSDNFIVN